jgi:hypothetical protein
MKLCRLVFNTALDLLEIVGAAASMIKALNRRGEGPLW